jgi:hypothetical protein
VYYLHVKRNILSSILVNIRKKFTVKNLIKICIIGILVAIFRYILMVKLDLDIKQTYDFFCLYIPTGIFAGIINLIYEDTYAFLSSNTPTEELPMPGTGRDRRKGGGTGDTGIIGGTDRDNSYTFIQENPAPPPPTPKKGVEISQQLKAGQINGPILINDPNNQNYVYDKDDTNQPLLGNIARALDHQADLNLTYLNKCVFTNEQRKFILAFLKHNHKEVYDYLIKDITGSTYPQPA